jgi:proteic killer suppression protein
MNSIMRVRGRKAARSRLPFTELNSATSLNDLRVPPSNHLEALKDDLKGKHSIRVNVQSRIVFEWRDGAPHSVVLVDYH